MSRFVNLEFGDESEDQSRSRATVKDEAYYLGKAQSSFTDGRFEPALRYYSKVLEFNPANASAWTGQVRALIELNEYREAKLWADKALERFPRDPELLAAKGVALARCGENESAMAYSDAAIEERGDTPYVWLARGDVLLARGEKRAEYCFEKAILLAPANWLYHWLSSRILHFHAQFARALKAAQQALGLDAARAVVWLQMGECQLALGMMDAAVKSFQQARELDPHWTEPQMALNKVSNAGLGDRMRGVWRQWFKR